MSQDFLSNTMANTTSNLQITYLLNSVDPYQIPRFTEAKVFEVKVKQSSQFAKIHQYDNYNQTLLDEILCSVQLSQFRIRKGDIVIETDIRNTKTHQDILRNGMVIFNGRKFQYLDRTLNRAGNLPCNFHSFAEFKLGYWDKIFNDNIVWLYPDQKYEAKEDMIVTRDYILYSEIHNMKFLLELFSMGFPILAVKSGTFIIFDKNLYDVYQINLHNEKKNEYHRKNFFGNHISVEHKPEKRNWGAHFSALIGLTKNDTISDSRRI